MPRFESEPDPVFWQLNASLRFDRRLAPHDVRGSRAHARALLGAGVLTAEELDGALEGLDAVESELDAGTFPFEAADEDIHMAIERRLTEIVGPLGGKIHTGRSRNDQVATDLALFVAERAGVAGGLLGAALSRCSSSPSATATGACPATPTCSAPSPSPSRHHLLAWFWMLRRDADRFAAARGAAAAMPLGSRRARRAQLGARPRGRGRRARLRRASSRTRSTPSPTATSRSTT